MLLTKLVQNNADSIKHDLTTPFFEELASISCSDQIHGYVMAIIRRGNQV